MNNPSTPNGGYQVAVKFFHKTSDGAGSLRARLELITCVRLFHALHSACDDRDDEQDLRHLTRLRDVLVDAPILQDPGSGLGLGPSKFRTTVMVFDWADGGDVQSLVHERGGIDPAEGATLFRQVMRGLRALHRRSIVHRDIKVRVGNKNVVRSSFIAVATCLE